MESSVLKELDKLVDRVADDAQTLEEINSEIHGVESSALSRAVAIVRKGIAFHRIERSREEHNCNTCSCTPHVEYYPEKGARCVKSRFSSQCDNNNNTGTNIVSELWLLSDGRWAEFRHTDEWTNWQNAWSRETRELVWVGNDPLDGWTYDLIIEGLVESLRERLNTLGKRVQEQNKRLEKIRPLTIE